MEKSSFLTEAIPRPLNNQALTGRSRYAGTHIDVSVGIYHVRTDVHFVMKVRPGRQPRISNITNYFSLLDPLSGVDTERKHVGVACMKPMLVPYNYIVAKSVLVKSQRYHLAVGSGHNWVPLTVCGYVYSFVNIVQAGKGVFVLAKKHGNMANTAPDGPNARNFR
jgi:hypothetical protein